MLGEASTGIGLNFDEYVPAEDVANLLSVTVNHPISFHQGGHDDP